MSTNVDYHIARKIGRNYTLRNGLQPAVNKYWWNLNLAIGDGKAIISLRHPCASSQEVCKWFGDWCIDITDRALGHHILYKTLWTLRKIVVTLRIPTQWQLREGTVLLATFRENYWLLAGYSPRIHNTVSGASFSADLPQKRARSALYLRFLSRKAPVQRHFFMRVVHGCMTSQTKYQLPSLPSPPPSPHLAAFHLF